MDIEVRHGSVYEPITEIECEAAAIWYSSFRAMPIDVPTTTILLLMLAGF